MPHPPCAAALIFAGLIALPWSSPAAARDKYCVGFDFAEARTAQQFGKNIDQHLSLAEEWMNTYFRADVELTRCDGRAPNKIATVFINEPMGAASFSGRVQSERMSKKESWVRARLLPAWNATFNFGRSCEYDTFSSLASSLIDYLYALEPPRTVPWQVSDFYRARRDLPKQTNCGNFALVEAANLLMQRLSFISSLRKAERPRA